MHLEKSASSHSLHLRVRLTAEGVAYPFHNHQFERLWQSTLNEALGGER